MIYNHVSYSQGQGNDLKSCERRTEWQNQKSQLQNFVQRIIR